MKKIISVLLLLTLVLGLFAGCDLTGTQPTTAPKGNSLEGVGITPDVEISVDDVTASAIYYETLDPQEDPQIQAAVNALQ